MSERCQICGYVLSEPEDGPLYCGPCKIKFPGRTSAGVDSEKQEDNIHCGIEVKREI